MPLSSSIAHHGARRVRAGDHVEPGVHGPDPIPAIIGPMLLAIDVGNTQTHLGCLRRRRAGRALALSHRLGGDRRRDRRADRGPAGAERDRARRDRRDLRLLGRAAAGQPVRGDVGALLRRAVPDVGPGVKTGMPIRIDNPLRGRRRPAGQRGRRLRAVRRRLRGRRLRHRDQLRRGLGRRRVPRRGDRARGRDLAHGADRARRADRPDRARPSPRPRSASRPAGRSSRA